MSPDDVDLAGRGYGAGFRSGGWSSETILCGFFPMDPFWAELEAVCWARLREAARRQKKKESLAYFCPRSCSLGRLVMTVAEQGKQFLSEVVHTVTDVFCRTVVFILGGGQRAVRPVGWWAKEEATRTLRALGLEEGKADVRDQYL